jgi:hypothetical protein
VYYPVQISRAVTGPGWIAAPAGIGSSGSRECWKEVSWHRLLASDAGRPFLHVNIGFYSGSRAIETAATFLATVVALIHRAVRMMRS